MSITYFFPGRLRVNDINSKRYKKPGEVEHSSCISPKTAQKKQNMVKPEDFVLRERLVDEKCCHHNVCHADECTLHIFYLC